MFECAYVYIYSIALSTDREPRSSDTAILTSMSSIWSLASESIKEIKAPYRNG